VELVLTNAENTANQKTAPLKLKSSESAGNILAKNVMAKGKERPQLEVECVNLVNSSGVGMAWRYNIATEPPDSPT
jgi:hypothetical protein